MLELANGNMRGDMSDSDDREVFISHSDDPASGQLVLARRDDLTGWEFEFDPDGKENVVWCSPALHARYVDAAKRCGLNKGRRF